MIGKLSGHLESIRGSQIILTVGGVGYLVTCTATTLRTLQPNTPLSLFIETLVREDAITLVGFGSESEQEWFRLLTTVQGVGSRVALSILSTLTPNQLPSIIMAQDKSALTKADGVGPKLALRLVTELKDKVLPFVTTPSLLKPTPLESSGTILGTHADAMSALINLGYGRAEAFAAVQVVTTHDDNLTLKDIIRLSLTEISKGRLSA